MIKIPPQLQEEGIKFILLGKKDKKPLEKWQNNYYSYNDEKLLNHLKNNCNYGIICGNGLIVIDADTNQLNNIVKKEFPETLTIKTGSGYHYYIYSIDFLKKQVLKDKEHLGEIQSNGSYVVGPNCIHPTGKKYDIEKNLQIIQVSKEIIDSKLEQYYSNEKLNKEIIIEGTSKGLRNESMFKLACSFREKDLNIEETFITLKGLNKNNNPPLPDSEIKQITESAYKYKKTSKTIISQNNINLFNNNRFEIIREFYNNQAFFYDESGLFWIWNEDYKVYQMIDEYDLISSLAKLSNNEEESIRSKFWVEILRGFKIYGRQKKPLETPKKWVQFKNKVIDYETKEEHEPTTEYFNTNTIPHNINYGETPIIDKIFTEWVGKEKVKLLKEIIAYCMIQDYPLHRIFCLTGTGLNGKGVFLRLLKKIIGDENTASTELDLLMDNRFETAKLYKKLICMMGETNFTEISKTSMLKKLSGQDLVGIEFKNKNPFDTTNYAKLIIATNSLPPTMDKTLGFYRRWSIIDFPNRFPEGIDIISTIPDKEIENLCGQCINLIQPLIDKGEFHEEGTLEDRKRKYEEKSNPLKTFIKENYEKDLNSEVPYFEFYDNFIAYLEDRGLRSLTKKKVSQLLDNEGFDIERKNIKDPDDVHNYKTWRFIIGIKTKNYDTYDRYDSSLTQKSYVRSESSTCHIGHNSHKFDSYLSKILSFVDDKGGEIKISDLVNHFNVANDQMDIFLQILLKKGDILMKDNITIKKL